MSKRALRRMPLEKLMDLKVDYAFKQLFGSEKNKEITVVFLNAVLQKTGRDTIREVVFIDQEVGGQFVEDKQSRLDIVVRTQTGDLINVEMQLSNQNDMVKRTLYYWSRLFSEQLRRGEVYQDLRPTITINICDFTLFSQTDHYHSTYHLYEDTVLERLHPEDDVLEVHFIEMKKFIQAWHDEILDPLDDLLVRWLLLLGMVDARKQRVYDEIYEELEALAMKDERLMEAFEASDEWSTTPEMRIDNILRLKPILDAESKRRYAMEKGKEEGRREGRREGRAAGIKEGRERGRKEGREKVIKEVIRKGYENGIDLSTLSMLTGYSEQDVQAVIQSFENEEK